MAETKNFIEVLKAKYPDTDTHIKRVWATAQAYDKEKFSESLLALLRTARKEGIEELSAKLRDNGKN